MADGPTPVLPDYGGGCICNVASALRSGGADWLPREAVAAQVVLLVLDGLGWEQLQERADLAPTLTSMAGGPITSVAPTTTATALTSITTGLPPAAHEVMGYRVRVGAGEVFNVLRWRTAAGDPEPRVVPEEFQRQAVFGGSAPPVVTRAEFESTGFTHAHLGGTRFRGWRVASSLPVLVGDWLGRGEPFVYAYYDGMDKIAHERGFGAFYDAELRATDRLVGDLIAALPPGAALVVTADHGQVEVDDAVLALAPEVLAHTRLVSGEGRFRWLHAEPGEEELLAKRVHDEYGELAWIRTAEELQEEGWFGGRLTPAGRARVGDVALIAHAPVAFADPADPGENALRCRHGSATPAEMLVPLLAFHA